MTVLLDADTGLGHRLAARRLQLQLTQRDVERSAGIAATTLSRLERPDCPLTPRYSTVEALAAALRIDIARLLYHDKELDSYALPAGRMKNGHRRPKLAVWRNGSEHRGVPSRARTRTPTRTRRRRAA